MGVPSRVLILQYGYLHEHGLDVVWLVLVVSVGVASTHFEAVPAYRLLKFYHLDLLQLLKAVLKPNSYLLWRIGLISLEVQVHTDL